MVDWKKILWASLGITVISYLLAWIYNYLRTSIPALANGIATIQFAAIDVNVGKQIQSGIDTSVAGKFLGSYLGAFGGATQWVLLFISAISIILIGMWINKMFDLGKTENTKFAWEMTLGAVALGLVFGYLSPSVKVLGSVVAMLIYFLIVALVYTGVRNLGAKNVLPVPTA